MRVEMAVRLTERNGRRMALIKKEVELNPRRTECSAAHGPGRVTAALLLTAAFVSVSPPQVEAQRPSDAAQAAARVAARLEPEIRRAMLDGSIPSLTVALANRDGEVWSAAFGESNLWARTPASTETVYVIGSTFKAQSTIALLQQMEQGKFDLDDPVHDYLGEMTIRGEDPTNPVLFRNLLTHTSGMPVDFGPHLVWGESAPLALVDYLTDSLRVVTPPLEGVVYSNMAYSLVAYLVEHFSGTPYKEYIRSNIWGPLGMTSTAFDLRAEMEERLSVPYVPDERTGRSVATDRLKANVWPAGITYGTIHDQARWVSFNLGDGTAGDTRLVSAETIAMMQTRQFDQFAGQPMAGGWGYEDRGYGLTWWTTTNDGQAYFAHSGSLPGYTAFVMGNRGRGHGVVFLTNGHAAHPHLVRLSNLALALMAEEMVDGGGEG
jgi:CubicO group peptidase (beta-lactamase class C family)